jgi:Domain of unknown function (DUF4136)
VLLNRKGYVVFHLLFFMAIVGLCVSAQDTRVNYMPGTDFSKYKTYTWRAIEGGAHPNQIVDAEIKESVDTQLAAKGFTKTDSGTADLTVTYQVAWTESVSGMPSGRAAFGGAEWQLRLALRLA